MTTPAPIAYRPMSCLPRSRKFPMTLIARAALPSLAILAAWAALLASAGVADARSGKPPARHKLAKPGTVVSAGPLKRRLWVPGATRSAFVLKYVTKNAFQQRALSTGTVFLPKGRMPRGGWPVISWAHGTVGLGDGCAPSRVGSAFPAARAALPRQLDASGVRDRRHRLRGTRNAWALGRSAPPVGREQRRRHGQGRARLRA